MTLAFKLALVGKGDANISGAFDHMIVRQNVAIGTYDHARSKAVFTMVTLPRHTALGIRTLELLSELLSEELLKNRGDLIRVGGTIRCFHDLGRRDIHNIGQNTFNDWSESGSAGPLVWVCQFQSRMYARRK